MKLNIFKDTSTRLPVKRITMLFDIVTTEEKRPGWKGSINVVFTTDREIQRLNRQFRSRNSPTDVLSFNIDPPDAESSVFGEIYISVPTARRQAKRYRVTLSEEFLRLVCHGLLHLYGYDHVKKGDDTRMKTRENYFLGMI